MKRREPNPCSCHACVNACKSTPGWFLPGEVEKAANLLGMQTKDFVSEYCVVEYWVSGDDDVYVLAPRKLAQNGGTVASFSSGFVRGRCVFLDDNDRCKIHAAKPAECRYALCCGGDDQQLPREVIMRAWRKSGPHVLIDEIVSRGRREEPTIFDALAALDGLLP